VDWDLGFFELVMKISDVLMAMIFFSVKFLLKIEGL
jgi:hypothetical protein